MFGERIGPLSRNDVQPLHKQGAGAEGCAVSKRRESCDPTGIGGIDHAVTFVQVVIREEGEDVRMSNQEIGELRADCSIPLSSKRKASPTQIAATCYYLCRSLHAEIRACNVRGVKRQLIYTQSTLIGRSREWRSLQDTILAKVMANFDLID